MDLSGNSIRTVHNIECLVALEKLDLRRNEITKFKSAQPLQYLHFLKLSNNGIESFDVTPFPALNLLYIDKNHLCTLTGLENCRYLETISLREQTATTS